MTPAAARAAALKLVLPLLLAACAVPLEPVLPEAASGWTAKTAVVARHFMVAAANPLATEAGYQILKAGGSALDAAIAVQMVLNLVEPQSSGIGGGALLMLWDGRSVQAWDGRETAPAAAKEDLFLGPGGEAVPYAEAVYGGRAVATPGVLTMLEQAHREHGVLPWARLFEPAIALAEQGFPISPRLHTLLARDKLLRRDPLARAHFYRADASPHPVGHLLRNPALAAVLRAVARDGSAALHRGPMASDIVARVRGHSVPGTLGMSDLAAYRARQREPICTVWRLRYRVCGFPPPSSGHLAMMQTLGVLERLPDSETALTHGAPGQAWLHRYTEASRLAFADRGLFVADPDFVAAPGGDWRTLLAPSYLQQRAALIGGRKLPTVVPGQPAPLQSAFAPMPTQPEHGTSHISVVDGAGRAVAMTTTVEAAFGARVMSDGGTGLAGGFLLNNQMTDFALAPRDAAGRPVANRIEPGKRPRSSMSPTLVFDARSGALWMTLGSPGGGFIIPFVTKTLLALGAWELDVQQAIDLPNFGTLGDPLLLERGRFDAATVQALRQRGHSVQEAELTSGVQAITRVPGGWRGGADPRREGVVRGD